MFQGFDPATGREGGSGSGYLRLEVNTRTMRTQMGDLPCFSCVYAVETASAARKEHLLHEEQI